MHGIPWHRTCAGRVESAFEIAMSTSCGTFYDLANLKLLNIVHSSTLTIKALTSALLINCIV
eukprot:scaffold22365_cov18-Prasinocladus_malaysianus.AAC.1